MVKTQNIWKSFNSLKDWLKGVTSNKFFVFLRRLLVILLLSGCASWCLSLLYAWIVSVVPIEELTHFSFWTVALFVVRFSLASAFIIWYWKVSLPFWKKHPVERDRYLFADLGWGMVNYSIGAIIMVVSVLVTLTNVMGVDTLFAFDTAPEAFYLWDFGIFERSWEVICQFADPGNIHSSTNFQGNFIALLSALAGVLCLSGLAVSALVSMIARRTQQWKKGLLHYYDKGFDKYVVIIGCNEQTMTIAKSCLCRTDVKYVLIQTRKDVEKARQRLELGLDREDEERIVFYSGERTSYEDIKALKLEKAIEVYILGEDMHSENEQDHDAYNMNCLEHIHKYIASCEEPGKANKEKEKLKCHVDFEYQSTYTIFKSTHVYQSMNDIIEFLPFNVHEIWAKKVLVDNYAVLPSEKDNRTKVQRYLPLDGDGIDYDSDKHVHLIIVGMNQMGTALGVQAALLAHYPNFHNPSKCAENLRTTITFIDENAVREGEYFMERFTALFGLCLHRTIVCNDKTININKEEEWIDPMDPKRNGRYKHLGANFMDIRWEFIEGNVASCGIQNYMSDIAKDKDTFATIAICFNHPQRAMAAALYLPEIILKRADQVLVYQQNNFDLIDKVSGSEKEWKRYAKLRPFGMIENCYKGDVYDNLLGKLANRLYNNKELDEGTSIDDRFIEETNRLWKELGIVMKMANINLVDHYATKIRSLKLQNENMYANAFDDKHLLKVFSFTEHCRWLTERLTFGYRPLDKDEFEYFYDIAKGQAVNLKSRDRKAKKEYNKGKYRAHLDICSNSMLDRIDASVRKNDEAVVKKMFCLFLWKNKIVTRQGLAQSKVLEGPKTDNADFLKFVLENMKEILVDSGSNNLQNPQKTITDGLQPYWICNIPVTQEMWSYVMMNSAFENKERIPVVDVSKDDVDDFITILNDQTGLHFRLPTKEEFKYAALGGEDVNTFKVEMLASLAWYKDNADKTLHKAAEKPANKFGLYDMLGNIWEWTSTPHGTNAFCFCGGSWKFGKTECDLSNPKETWCSYWTPDFKSSDLGFRLVLSLNYSKEKRIEGEWKGERDLILQEINNSMVDVPGGTFIMGTDAKMVLDGVETLEDERPAHKVKLNAFRIADAPVTQRQWRAIMGENNSIHRGDELPVENVSYSDVMTFLRKLKELTGGSYRLATEAEWEYVAKGAKSVEKNSSPDYFMFCKSNDPDYVSWHNGITKNTHPVKQKSPVRIGGKSVYDMCGNVWEWCSDWYDANYYSECKELHLEGIENPTGGDPSKCCTHVMRGGSWKFPSSECRVTRRTYWLEDYKSPDLGFRLAMDSDY